MPNQIDTISATDAENTTTAKARKKKLTSAELKNLEQLVCEELNTGAPLESVAYELGISDTIARNIYFKLIQENRIDTSIPPVYFFEKASVKLNALRIAGFNEAEFFKIDIELLRQAIIPINRGGDNV